MVTSTGNFPTPRFEDTSEDFTTVTMTSPYLPSSSGMVSSLSSFPSPSSRIYLEEDLRKREVLAKADKLAVLQNTFDKLKKYSEKTKTPYFEVLEAFLTEEQLELYNNRHTILEEAEKIRDEDKKQAEDLEDSLNKYVRLTPDRFKTAPSRESLGRCIDCYKEKDRNIFHTPNLLKKKEPAYSVFTQQSSHITN